jgi:transposase
MFEQRDMGEEQQREFWIVAQELPAATPDGFYRRVNQTLEKMGFAKKVWEVCKPAYADASKGGRPGIDPVVYLKMLMVGFFENLPSERAIASRCADSFSIRGFLGYSLTENTPDHSSLSVIRQRLSLAQFDALHLVLLRALRSHGLLKGRKLGIDSSIIEANASLRELQHRNSEEKYWDYVKRLACEAGVDPDDTKAVRRFDKKRSGRKTSNQEWVNPHDAEAKVGRTKHGATDMIYKPEHVSDLESGAIIDVTVRPGDAADNDAGMAQRVLAAVGTLIEVAPETKEREKLGVSVTADEGYFAVEQIGELQRCGVRTVVADPHEGRRRADAPVEHRQTLRRAACATRSESGKALLRKRGEHLERGFAHVLDHGGLRRATLRGCENLTKRHLIAALSFNLSLLLRTIFGTGTVKQWLAGARQLILRCIGPMVRLLKQFLTRIAKSCHALIPFTDSDDEPQSWQLDLAA